MGKGNLQLQAEAEERRKEDVDAKNKKAVVNDKAKQDALANTPLNAEEMAFCLDIKPRMNNGRRADAPMQADVLRYSKLRGRMDIPQVKVETKDGE